MVIPDQRRFAFPFYLFHSADFENAPPRTFPNNQRGEESGGVRAPPWRPRLGACKGFDADYEYDECNECDDDR